MTIKKGFGSLTDSVINLYVLGNPAVSNRNLITILSAKTQKQITSIICGYTLPNPSTATGLTNGRLLVCSGKFEGSEIEISVLNAGLPQELANVNVLLDVPILGNRSPEKIILNKPMLFDESTDVSIILTYCGTTGGASSPATESVTAFLNVDGVLGENIKLFKELR